MCTEREVVVLLARESREVVYDDEVDFTLMRAAVLQQCLELTDREGGSGGAEVPGRFAAAFGAWS